MRTEVGIVEWAGRVRDAVAVHRSVADALGRRVGGADIGARHDLLDRARRHGWCADEWATVAPVLHDVDPGAVLEVLDAALHQALVDVDREADGRAALEAEASVADRLVEHYEGWKHEAGPIADAPYRDVVDRVVTELMAGTPA
ncbi:MAG: hypothetical protein ACHQIG_12870 [Acidimicrobiia bacterium]